MNDPEESPKIIIPGYVPNQKFDAPLAEPNYPKVELSQGTHDYLKFI